ncbi:MAG: hypothetical protein HC877_01855 [Thioploca sp.]|nr:hypothetical protein [Thioploca sp.]
MSTNLLRIILCLLIAVSINFDYVSAADTKYLNPEYGFSVMLPESSVRHESQPPAPQHGVAIDLHSGGRIWIDGSYDVSFQGSARAALKQILKEADVKLTNLTKQMKVAHLEAVGTSYSKAQLVSTRVVAYRARSKEIAIIYTFGLDTTRTKQREDDKLFQKIIRSFCTMPLPE